MHSSWLEKLKRDLPGINRQRPSFKPRTIYLGQNPSLLDLLVMIARLGDKEQRQDASLNIADFFVKRNSPATAAYWYKQAIAFDIASLISK